MRKYTPQEAEDVFWSKVNKDGPILPGMETPCWEWLGARPSGKWAYGNFRYEGKVEKAHRIAWLFQYGPVPPGLNVLHECDNPSCVRHLFLGTHQDNMTDRNQKGRQSTARAAHNGRAKLTWEKVDAIRAARGVKQRDLAALHGVSQRAIFFVLHNKTWIR